MHRSIYLEEGLHSTSSSTTTSLDRETWLHNSNLQSVAETSLMQLVNTVAADLNLPTRVSPPQPKVSRPHLEMSQMLQKPSVRAPGLSTDDRGQKTAQEKKQIPGNGGSQELFGLMFP